jgi:hypothetical protein
MKTLSEKELQGMAKDFFEKNPEEKVLFGLHDGNLFTESNKNAALLHAKSLGGAEVYTFVSGASNDVEEEHTDFDFQGDGEPTEKTPSEDPKSENLDTPIENPEPSELEKGEQADESLKDSKAGKKKSTSK